MSMFTTYYEFGELGERPVRIEYDTDPIDPYQVSVNLCPGQWKELRDHSPEFRAFLVVKCHENEELELDEIQALREDFDEAQQEIRREA